MPAKSMPLQPLKHIKVQQSQGGLQNVLQHAQTLLSIQKLICETIDTQLLNKTTHHVKVASFENGLLHLLTSSPAIATRIKYSQRLLISFLRKQAKPLIVDTIKISVRPDSFSDALLKRKQTMPNAIPISKSSADHIADSAQNIEDDALRNALLKLSTSKLKPGI